MSPRSALQRVFDGVLSPHFLILRDAHSGELRAERCEGWEEWLRMIRTRVPDYKIRSVLQDVSQCIPWSRPPREDLVAGMIDADTEEEAQHLLVVAEVQES